MIQILFRQLIDPSTSTYTYILADPISKEAIIIDPVKEQFPRDLQLLQELGLKLRYIMETHVHADHITSAALLRKETRAKIMYSKRAQVHGADLLLDDQEELSCGALRLHTIYTPGHTDTCVSILCQNMLFTGDSLMIRGTGRTDFQNGSAEQLYHSIQKLYAFPDETPVYPGHNYRGATISTIGEEKRFNPRIRQETSQEKFVGIMNSLQLAKPAKLDIAVPANMYCGALIKTDELYEVYRQRKEHEVILDVRSPEEYREGHIPGSKNIPVTEIAQHLENMKNDSTIYVHCHKGGRAKKAVEILESVGIHAFVVEGGMAEWQEKGYPLDQY